MASREHIAVLKEGVESWNKWRRSHQRTIPNLRSANLSGLKLRGVDFRHADLKGADFEGTWLEEATFDNADLGYCSFRDLYSTTEAKGGLDPRTIARILVARALSWDRLTNASFRAANLYKTQFDRAVFKGVRFDGARLQYAQFNDVDFSQARGLSTCSHSGPSMVTTTTLALSKGAIPKEFLKGIGLADWEVEASRLYDTKIAHSEITDIAYHIVNRLTGDAVQYYSCFISYCTKDQDFANRLHADLQGNGVRCWYAPEDLKTGEKFRSRIHESIHVQDKLLLVLTKDSIESDWVESEVETAFERESREGRSVLFPIRLDDAVMKTRKAWAAHIRRTRNIGDFTQWQQHAKYTKAFNRLLRDLRAQPEGKAEGETAS